MKLEIFLEYEKIGGIYCMSLIVQKFGGSSVADVKKLENVARIITSTKKGNDVVVAICDVLNSSFEKDILLKFEELNIKNWDVLELKIDENGADAQIV